MHGQRGGAPRPTSGTVDVVHDLEVLRRDLGEPQVSFVGLSYGTLIGLLWAEAYPGSVRAMVLDGVVDPTVDGYSISREQLSAVDDSLAAIDKACAADATCPVTAAGGVTKAYDELARRIEAGTVHQAGVGPTQLAYAFFYATYGSDHWPTFWRALADGLAGDLTGVACHGRSFDALASYAPFALVTCLDTPHAARGRRRGRPMPAGRPAVASVRGDPVQRAPALRLLAPVPLRAPPRRRPGHARRSS